MHLSSSSIRRVSVPLRCFSRSSDLLPRRAVTAGSDGEIVVHTWDGDALSLKPKTHRRVHKGAINCMVAISSTKVATVADDGCLYSSEIVGEGITPQLIHRATLPLRLLAAHKCADDKILLATYGDELRIKIVAHDGALVADQPVKKSVVGLHFVHDSHLVLERHIMDAPPHAPNVLLPLP